jgi:hypothetical protein
MQSMGTSMLKVAFVDAVPRIEIFVDKWLRSLTPYETLTAHRLQSERPDLVFYGDGKSGRYRDFTSSTRVFITYENLYPDFSEADYAMAYMFLKNERYLRMPSWAIIHDPELFIKDSNYVPRIMQENREFCAFVVSNGNARRTGRRLNFFRKLNEQRRVNSGGRVLNNIGSPVHNRHDFAREHRFYMAFENASFPGYTTEKIADGMVSGCIPIYWGDPNVDQDFNPRSFINVSNFSNDEEAIKYILQVDTDKALYDRYLAEPFFHNNKPPEVLSEDRILGFFRKILEGPRPRNRIFAVRSGLFKVRRRMQPYLEAIVGPKAANWNHTFKPPSSKTIPA